MNCLEADSPRENKGKKRKKERQGKARARLPQQEQSKHTHCSGLSGRQWASMDKLSLEAVIMELCSLGSN